MTISAKVCIVAENIALFRLASVSWNSIRSLAALALRPGLPVGPGSGAGEPGRAARSRAREHVRVAGKRLEECEKQDRFAEFLEAFSLS